MSPDSTQPRRIFLIGFMGAGKTSVGKVLAQRLAWNFFDLDEVIEQREQKTVAQIFEQCGERVFREIESHALTELLLRSKDGSVIALGGGAFAQPVNRETMKQAGGVTVLLTAPLDELERRCRAAEGTRPLARDGDRFRELFAARRNAYALAQFHVETLNKEVAEVADEIERIPEIELITASS